MHERRTAACRATRAPILVEARPNVRWLFRAPIRRDGTTARPASRRRNGFAERLNGRMRDEPSKESLFFGLDHTRSLITAWVQGLRHAAAAFSLGYLTPTDFAKTITAPGSGAPLSNSSRLRRLLNPRPTAQQKQMGC